MARTSIENLSLRQLKNKFECRDFAIPEIQRQYVWNKKQIASLMDSIFQNYPIGMGLLWRAKYSNAVQIRPNNKTIVPPFNSRNKNVDLIIDGQQRLSTLYGVINNSRPIKEAGSQIDFGELYFNCNKEGSRFVFSKKDDIKGFVNLSTLIFTPPQLLKSRFKLTVAEHKEVLKCRTAFNSYKFSFQILSESNYARVKEIFIRINSGGTKVSKADTLFAKATDIHLRDHLLNVRRSLNGTFNTVSIEAMQNTIALAYGAKRIGVGDAFEPFLKKLELDKKNNANFSRTWKKLQYGYEEASDFLVHYLKVPSIKLLPSQNIYSMIAYFFYLNRRRAKPNQINEIKKWFWHTACGERYSGSGFNTNIPADIKFFERLAKGVAKYSVIEKIDSIEFLRKHYSKAANSSAVKAYYIMLRMQKPLFLSNGHDMQLDNYSSVSNRKDRHHIYPYELMYRNNFNLAWVNSIANICYVESDENQSISNKHPKTYFQLYRKNKHFPKVMKGHLIPYTKDSPVWDTDLKKAFPRFLELRGKAILNAIDTLAGDKIFSTFSGLNKF